MTEQSSLYLLLLLPPLLACWWLAFQPVPTRELWSYTAYHLQHIIIIVRENHSFDNLFGRFPGADGTRVAHVGSKVVPLNDTPDHLRVDLGHGGDSALLAINGGKMNAFDKVLNAIQNGEDVADSQ